LAVLSARYTGSVPSASSTARRTKSTTISGTSSSAGKHPIRRYDFNIRSRASRCSSESVASAAHSSSSRVGEKNRCSSCAVISRLNRGYAVRSIDVTTHPRTRTTLNITTNDTALNG